MCAPSVAFVLPLLTGFALGFTGAARIPLEARLNVAVKDRTILAEDLPSALAKVAGEYKIPMVIEWIDRPGKNGVQASLKDGTVRDLIESVVASQPGYGVETTDGVVHVFNRRFLRDRQNFLNLKTNNFDREQTPASLVGGDLLQLAAQTVLPPRPPSPGRQGGFIISRGVSLDEPKVTLRLENVTIREALQTLTREADNEIWVVTFLGSREVTPTGFRRTITLWNDAPPGNEPVWDFFRWGQAPRRALDAARRPWMDRTSRLRGSTGHPIRPPKSSARHP